MPNIEIQETEDNRFLVAAYDRRGREIWEYSRVRDYLQDAEEYAENLRADFAADAERTQ